MLCRIILFSVLILVAFAAGAAYAASVYFLEDAAPDGLDVRPVGKANVTLARFHAADHHVTAIWSRSRPSAKPACCAFARS